MKVKKVLLLIISIICLSACNELTSIDKNKYVEISNNYNLVVNETPEDILNVNEKYIKSLTMSTNSKYNSLFYVFNDIDVSKDTFENEKADIESQNDNSIYSERWSKIGKQVFIRINSCGHYFHTSCFIQGLIKNKNKVFTCPICSKNQNNIIN